MVRHASSPITDEARLQAATAYIAANSLRLAKTVLGRELPIGRSLLELRHHDFGVLGFVVDQADH